MQISSAQHLLPTQSAPLTPALDAPTRKSAVHADQTRLADPTRLTKPEMMKMRNEKMTPPGATLEPMTLEGLQEAWGTDSTKYDLNKDGTVDIADLLTFLTKASPASQPADPPIAADNIVPKPVANDAPADAPVDGPDLNNTPTVEGFDAAWGSSDASYDLNADGTVNMQDLLQFLSQQPGAAPANEDDVTVVPLPAVPDPSANDELSHDDIAAPAADLTLDGFLKSWGSDSAEYDINESGTVDIQDLLQFLAQQSSEGEDIEASVNEMFAKVWGSSDSRLDLNADGTVNVQDLLQFLSQTENGETEGAREPANFDRATRVAEALSRRFDASGFGNYPPGNLQNILDRLDLDSGDRQRVMDHLQSRYPDGLGINLRG